MPPGALPAEESPPCGATPEVPGRFEPICAAGGVAELDVAAGGGDASAGEGALGAEPKATLPSGITTKAVAGDAAGTLGAFPFAAGAFITTAGLILGTAPAVEIAGSVAVELNTAAGGASGGGDATCFTSAARTIELGVGVVGVGVGVVGVVGVGIGVGTETLAEIRLPF